MKDIQKLIKIFFGFFVSITVIFVLVQKILQKKKLAESSSSEVSSKAKAVPAKKETKTLKAQEKNVAKEVAKDNSKNALLSSRQKKILSIFEKTADPVEMDEISAAVKGVHVRTLRRDLAKLSDLRLIKKAGTTKGTSYKRV